MYKFFECFHDTSELVYLFKDAIEGDRFLDIIIREKDEKKIINEINEKTQARYQEYLDSEKSYEKKKRDSGGESNSKEKEKKENELQEIMANRAKERCY